MVRKDWNDDSGFTAHWREVRATTPKQSMAAKLEVRRCLNDHISDFLEKGMQIVKIPNRTHSGKSPLPVGIGAFQGLMSD